MAFGRDSAVGIAFQGKDDVSPVVKGIRNSMDRLKKDAATGFGLGAGISVFNLAKRAIGGVVDIFGDAVQAAADEEASIAMLTRAIEENDKAWDGNIDAVEDVISAREELAFSDDEQRDSLRSLVSVTGDVTKALEVQRTAMDLARLKGLDLKTATELLGKVYAGNLGMLSRYGIVLRKGTTATEALAEIQRRARGQAEAYAETTQGKQVRAQLALNNAMEDLGATLTPLAANLAEFAADAIPEVAKWVGNLADAFNNLNRAINPHVALQQDALEIADQVALSLGLEADELKGIIEQRQKAADAAADYAEAQFVALDVIREEIIAAQNIGGSLEDQAAQIAKNTDLSEAAILTTLKLNLTVDDAAKVMATWETETGVATSALDEMTEAEKLARDAARELILTKFRASEWGAQIEVAADTFQLLPRAADFAARQVVEGLGDLPTSIRKTIREGKADVRKAATELRWALQHPFAGERYVKWLAAQQEKAQTKLVQAVNQGKVEAANALAAYVDALQLEMDRLDDMNFSVSVYTDVYGRRRAETTGGRAGGGPVVAGETYVVGEHGREVLTMGSQSGYVTPNSRLGGGGDVYLDGYLVGRILDERMGRAYGTTARTGSYRRAD